MRITVKQALANQLKNWMAYIQPEDLTIDSPIESIEYHSETNLGAVLRIKTKVGGTFYFEIKVKELM